jgi:hypothetical protein
MIRKSSDLARRQGWSWVLLAVLVVMSAACGTSTVATGSGSASTGGTNVTTTPSANSLSAAKSEAKRLVDDTVTAVFPGAPGQQSGTGQLPCDPPDAGLVSFEYGMTMQVPANQVDQLAVNAWDHFKQLGVQPDGANGNSPKVGGQNAPAPRGKLNGYRVGITGNRENSVVHVKVTTPCLKPES